MSTTTKTTHTTHTPPPLSPSLYRAVWRWHFYAGLLVLPFLIWLAVTGAAFLFQKEIDGWYHRDLLSVPAASAEQPALPHGRIVDAALAAHPGAQWFRYTPALDGAHSASVGIALPRGERLAVYLDPATARVLGTLPERGTLMWTVRQLHSLKYFGPVARGFIEMAAGWALVLVATGLYLWWPRGGKGQGGVVTVRGRPGQRVFWRDVHAITGVSVGLVLAFLAISGMPWSVLWGSQVNAWANGQAFGYPAGVRVQLPMSGERLADAAHLPWTLQQARVPGDPHEGHDGHDGPGSAAPAVPEPLLGTPLPLDAAMAVVGRLGLAPGYTVTPPRGARGVFSASAYPDDLARQRVVHIDQYSGAVLLDQGYADYGPAGQALEWGINVHLGQQYGAINQWGLLVACAAVVLLCATGAVAWWKRRPRGGGLAVPPLPARPEVLAGLTALLALGGVVFPLVGLSLLLVLAADLWWQRRLGAVGRLNR
ncbi:PepSY domain-containing protein [Acidovorax sp. FG27]|uniref:PepSY-associated TM helix domain-containing protein n=1 Tax=Acidovorax sp. FG27 TaxID=3133652 RepID=UPI0030E9FB63